MTDHVFVHAVDSILRDNRFDRVIQRQRTGKLDTLGLYRVATGSTRIFKKKLERKHKDYDCTILVDVSGSMQHTVEGRLKKYQMAADSACVLHRALKMAGIPTRIVAFNILREELVGWDERKPDYKLVKAKIHAMAACNVRDEKVNTHVFKSREIHKHEVYGSYREVITSGHKDIEKMNAYLRMYYHKIESKKFPISHAEATNLFENVWFVQGGNCENNDAWALHHVVHEALERKGEHIVVVMSDGQPTEESFSYPDYHGKLHNGRWDLEQEVKESLRKGIYFVGIGIDSSDVQDYYPNEFCDVLRASTGTGKKLTGRAIFEAVASQLKKHVRKG